MQHDPRLHMELEQPPRPWGEAGAASQQSEELFLEGMRADFGRWVLEAFP